MKDDIRELRELLSHENISIPLQAITREEYEKLRHTVEKLISMKSKEEGVEEGFLE